MYTSTLSSALALLLATATASPLTRLTPRTNDLTAASLLTIAPKSNSCPAAGAKYANECRTAAQALAPIQASFQTYKITDPATQAAVISTIAFESGDFKYAIHHFPSDNPGQGTRNMQSAKFNEQYADSIPELKGAVAGAKAAGPNGIVNLLVHYADYDFGSAAWFLTSQCEKGVVEGLKKPGDAAFKAYLGCIGTSPTDDRSQYYKRALAAYGLKSS
ncbi:hypothetical protein ACLMJK_002608 [Lecanora helva]